MNFLWLSEEDAAQFFLDVGQLEYTDENRLRNDFRSRDSWEMRLFDAWGHCYMGAAATNDLGERSAWALGGGSEVLHEGLSWISLNFVAHDSFSQDTYNQSVGRAIGTRHPGGDFARLSFDAMVEGRLDLTLAGIPRGTRLRRIRYAVVRPTTPARIRLEQWRQRQA
jgi:hypothetical protein